MRGHVLTGTVASGDYPPLPISHGRVAGARVAFDVVQHAEDHAFTMKYTGTLHGGRLPLTLTFPLGGHQVQMVARRKP